MTNISSPESSEKSSPKQFSDFDISPDLKKGIEELGYLTPTAFQNSVFEGYQSGKNIVGKGRSNYGKSLAFSLPIVAQIDPKSKTTQALILCENSKLCDLAVKECRALGRHLNIIVEQPAGITSDSCPHIIICILDDLPKVLDSISSNQLSVVFFDALNQDNTEIALEKLSGLLNKKVQVLIFGEETITAFENLASKFLAKAAFVDNIDMPKKIEPTTHCFHLQNDEAPKPRTLLAALEFHKAKNCLVACEDAAEAELLSRYLARYGYKIKVAAGNITNLLAELLDNKIDILISPSNLIRHANLEKVPLLILFNMIEQAKDYEAVTQFSKKAINTPRKVVSLVASRELGYLAPIKAQCLININEILLPEGDDITSLCAQRIVQNLTTEAGSTELAFFADLAKLIIAHESAPTAIALLLKNYLINQAQISETKIIRNDQEKRVIPTPRPRETNNNDKHEKKREHPESPEGITRLYVTLGKFDGLEDLASLAQHLSQKSGVDLGHFSGSGMIRDQSAHIEVDDEVAEAIIAAVHNSEKPNIDGPQDGAQKQLVVCERARHLPQRNIRRPMPRRRPNYTRNK